MRFPDPRHPHHLGTCSKHRSCGPAPDILNQKSWARGPSYLCFQRPSSMLRFEIHSYRSFIETYIGTSPLLHYVPSLALCPTEAEVDSQKQLCLARGQASFQIFTQEGEVGSSWPHTMPHVIYRFLIGTACPWAMQGRQGVRIYLSVLLPFPLLTHHGRWESRDH